MNPRAGRGRGRPPPPPRIVGVLPGTSSPPLPGADPPVQVGDDEVRVDPARSAEGRRHGQARPLDAVGCGRPPTQARNDSQPAAVSASVNPQCVGDPSTTIAVVRFLAGASLAYSPAFSTSTRPSLSVCRETIFVFPTFPVGV